jgi:hypothetical protein
LTRAFHWMSKIFRATELSQDSVSRLPAAAVEDPSGPVRSQPRLQSSGSVIPTPPSGPVGATQKRPVRCGASESAEPQRKSAAQRLRHNANQRTEKVARRAPKLRKDQSEKKSQKMSTAVTKTAKNTVRTNRKIPPVSNSASISKVSV